MKQRNRPVTPYSVQRFGMGKRIVTQADIELRDCPACGGDGKVTLADIKNPLGKKKETAWWCQLCENKGVIGCTESTYRDLQEHYGGAKRVVV